MQRPKIVKWLAACALREHLREIHNQDQQNRRKLHSPQELPALAGVTQETSWELFGIVKHQVPLATPPAAQPTNVPLVVAKPQSSISAQPSILLGMIDKAEATMREHFQKLRTSLVESPAVEAAATPTDASQRKAIERLLQAEREHILQQRAQEQEQVRATMQQLADAWLKLEQEQLAQSNSVVAISAHHRERPRSQWQPWLAVRTSRQRPWPSVPFQFQLSHRARFQQTVATSAHFNSRSNEELFHKLRLDLLKIIHW